MFRALIKKEIEALVPAGTTVLVTASEQPEHGDYASNVALVVAKKMRQNPKEVAEEIKTKVVPRLNSGRFLLVERVEIAGPGFLNFYIAPSALTASLQGILENTNVSTTSLDNLFPSLKASTAKPVKINLEFISANPTGPLTMANGRGGFYGDVLANVLEAVGHDVTREYYINDIGNQIKLLGESIQAAEGKIPEKEEYYKGEYIKELNGKSASEAAAFLLESIQVSLKKAGIEFDVWFSEEKNLHQTEALKKTLKFLQEKKMVCEHEGALWLGDPEADKAVLIKSDQQPTYFLADLAYHYNKFIERKFDIAIDVWGADHHGYMARMKKGVEALGINSYQLHILIMQLVRLMSGDKEVRMSKRAGNFVTMDELLAMVGVDAVRWFFLEKSLNTHMDFDLDLARERSKKNPVYYVEYAHARAASIVRNAKSNKVTNFFSSLFASKKTKEKETHNLNILNEPQELALIKKILQLSEVVEDIASDYEVQRLPRYTYELARTFTDFYENCRVIDEANSELTSARLALVTVTKKTLSTALALMGISAPSSM